MKKLILMLLPAVAMGLAGCKTPADDHFTTSTHTTTTTTTSTPMSFGSVSVNQGEGTVAFVIPANTMYTIEWQVNSAWAQRIMVSSSRMGILEKQTVTSNIKSGKWRHQHKTTQYPETITVLMEHKDDAGNWFPSAIRTRDVPTDSAVRFAI